MRESDRHHGRTNRLVWAFRTATLCMAAGVPAMAGAQVRGIISGRSGEVVSSVTVELYNGSDQLASRTSDDAGRFSFPARDTRTATMMLARRLGYVPLRLRLTPADTVVHLVMERPSQAAAAVTAHVLESACPNRDDPEARALWQSVRSRYSSADDVGLATSFTRGTTLVSASSLGTVDSSGSRTGERVFAGNSRVAWRKRIAEQGYVWRESFEGLGHPADSWIHPPLESDFAQHFIDTVFAAKHNLSVISRDEHEMVIAFCERSRKQPYMEGLMMVAADTTLVKATWRFFAPAPAADAGGEVFFERVGSSTSGHVLLPARGLTWEMTDGGQYAQTYQSFRRWIVQGERGFPVLTRQ
jgi:hypothetical protein